MLDGVPPHNREAERSVLGSMIRDNRIIHEIAASVRQDDFYMVGHQRIFEGVISLAEQGKVVDYITLGDWLKSHGALEDAGGHAYLVDLWDAAPGSASNAPQYAEIVRQKSIVRSLLHAANQIASEASNPGAEANELLDKAEQAVFRISKMGIIGKTRSQPTVVDECLVELDRRTGHNANGEVFADYIETGWADVDAMVGGMYNTELTIVAARPSVGKTLVAVQLAKQMAEHGHPVLYSCLEQRDIELVFRMFSSSAQVSSVSLRKGTVSPEERQRLLDAADKLRGLPIEWAHDPGQTMLDISANARRLKSQGKCSAVVVDYLQLVSPENWRDPRQEQVAKVARRLKILAGDINVPVVALAQLNREVENRKDRRPRLADLRESGEIEQSADTVILLHKPEDEDKHRSHDKLEVIVGKNRHGPTGEALLIHDKKYFGVNNFAGGNGY